MDREGILEDVFCAICRMSGVHILGRNTMCPGTGKDRAHLGTECESDECGTTFGISVEHNAILHSKECVLVLSH